MHCTVRSTQPERMAFRLSVSQPTKISQKGKWQHEGKAHVVNRDQTMKMYCMDCIFNLFGSTELEGKKMDPLILNLDTRLR
jgi:hypothetical protein